MDENGDAEGNFTLISLKNKGGVLGLYPVGLFLRSSSQLPVSKNSGKDGRLKISQVISDRKCDVILKVNDDDYKILLSFYYTCKSFIICHLNSLSHSYFNFL